MQGNNASGEHMPTGTIFDGYACQTVRNARLMKGISTKVSDFTNCRIDAGRLHLHSLNFVLAFNNNCSRQKNYSKFKNVETNKTNLTVACVNNA